MEVKRGRNRTIYMLVYDIWQRWHCKSLEEETQEIGIVSMGKRQSHLLTSYYEQTSIPGILKLKCEKQNLKTLRRNAEKPVFDLEQVWDS